MQPCQCNPNWVTHNPTNNNCSVYIACYVPGTTLNWVTNIISDLGGGLVPGAHLTVENTKAQRDSVTFPRSHSIWDTNLATLPKGSSQRLMLGLTWAQVVLPLLVPGVQAPPIHMPRVLGSSDLFQTWMRHLPAWCGNGHPGRLPTGHEHTTLKWGRAGSPLGTLTSGKSGLRGSGAQTSPLPLPPWITSAICSQGEPT